MRLILLVLIILASASRVHAGLVGDTIQVTGCFPTIVDCEPFTPIEVAQGDSDLYFYGVATLNVDDDTIVVSSIGGSSIAQFNGFVIEDLDFDGPAGTKIIGLSILSNTFSTFSESDLVVDVFETIAINLGNDGGAGEAIIQIETNAPPFADLGGVSVGVYNVIIGDDLTLDASGSFDPDPGDSIVLYEWDFNFDGIPEISTSSPTYTIAAEDLTSFFNLSVGVATQLRLLVYDETGFTDLATGTVRNGGVETGVCIFGEPAQCTEQTQTGLQFLEFEHTLGLSYDEVLAELYEGGQLFGYRFATHAEVLGLLVDAAIPEIPGTSADNAGPIEGLISYTGATVQAGNFEEALGSTADPGGLPNSRKFISISYSQGQTGTVITNGSQLDNVSDPLRAHWLVRETDTTDTDGDAVPDYLDNCIEVPTESQRDTDGDGYGNACDPDFDNNGVVNFLDISGWIPFFNTACGDVDQDLNGDGGCNFGDFATITQYFNQPPGPSGIAP